MKLLHAFSLFVCLSLFGADGTPVYKYIEEDGGGDYTTLEDWEAGRQTNCVTASSVEYAVIRGSWDAADLDGDFAIGGWTTGVNNYIVITNSTSKHDGKRFGSATTAYRIDVTAAGASTLVVAINEDYVRVYGLQISITAANLNSCTGFTVNSLNDTVSDVIIANCIVRGVYSGTSTGNRGMSIADGCGKIFNCIVYDVVNGTTTSYGIDVAAPAASSWSLYNNTVFNCYTAGLRRGSSTVYAFNNVAQNCNDGFSGTFDASSNYNRSDVASDSPGANSINDTDDVLFVSTTGGSEDFHLSASEVSNPNATSVIDYTSDQSSGLFSNDIDYATRSGSWDIGADEYVAAGGVNPQIIIINMR